MALELTEEQIRGGWTIQRLGDLGEIFDGPHATAKKIESGPYYLSISSLVDGRLALAESAHISEEDFSKWTKRVTPIYPDLLFSYETKLGSAALMPRGVRASLGRRMGLIRFDTQKVNPHFMLYKWLSPEFQRYIQQHKISGATVERIALSELGKWEVALPPKPGQDRIAEILVSLDDKIEANNALLDSLDGLGNALILQKINDVSETCQLSEVAEIVMGKSPAGATLNEDSEGLIFYQGRRDFGFRYPTPRVFTSAPTRVAEPGDILLSVRAPVGDLNRTDEECCVGRGVAAIRAKNGNTAQLFYLLRNIPSLWSPYEGEGTVFSSINRKQVQNLQIPVVDNFEEFEDIEKSILSLTQENLALSETRDLLIRKLIK